VNGSASPFTYIWNNGATTEDLSMLTAGTYKVTVTDNNACQDSVTVIINQPLQLALQFLVTDVINPPGNNGAINLTVSGGTMPFSYMWSIGLTTQNLTALAAGIYCVTVTDGNLCTVSGCDTVQDTSIGIANCSFDFMESLTPNPFVNQSTLHLILHESTNLTIEVYDGAGRLMKSNELPSGGRGELYIQWTDIAGTQVESGLYYVKVVTEKGTALLKAIKM